jgi:glycosyltransferase involved in cell wall biosynthesis
VREIVIVPTYNRNEYLHCCLRRIREQDKRVDIMVSVDRCFVIPDETLRVIDEHGAFGIAAGEHNGYGNSYNVLRALQIAHLSGPELFHVCEDDTMMHPDCLAWHREMHEDMPGIFASCGWVFNRHAPINNDLQMAPWYYAPNACFSKEKLGMVVRHARTAYFDNMREYVLATFPNSQLHNRGRQENTAFFEQDAIVQYVLGEDKSQCVWRGIALVDHVGASGYNRKKGPVFEGTLDERVTKVEALIADPHWRAELFGREIVEREIGHRLGKREYVHKVSFAGWESMFVSELRTEQLPRRLNSVDLPDDAVVTSSLRDVLRGEG